MFNAKIIQIAVSEHYANVMHNLLEIMLRKKTFLTHNIIYFGRQMMEVVIPHLFNGDSEGMLERATIAKGGKLTERFSFLRDYVDGK